MISSSTISLPLSLRSIIPRSHIHGSLAEHYRGAEMGIPPVEVVVETSRDKHFNNDPDSVLVTALNCPQNADVRLGPGVKVKTSDMLVELRNSLTGQKYLVPTRVVGEITEVAEVEEGAVIWMLCNDAPEWVSTVYVRTPRNLCDLDGVDSHVYHMRQREIEPRRRRHLRTVEKYSPSEPPFTPLIASYPEHIDIHDHEEHQYKLLTRGEYYSPYDVRPQSSEPPFSPLFKFQLDHNGTHDITDNPKCQPEVEYEIGSYSSHNTKFRSSDHGHPVPAIPHTPNTHQHPIYPTSPISEPPNLSETPDSPESYNSFLSFSPLPPDHVSLSISHRMRSALSLPIARNPISKSSPARARRTTSRWETVRASMFNFLFRHRRQ